MRKPDNARGFTIAVTIAFVLFAASLIGLAASLIQHARMAASGLGNIRHGLAWPLVIVASAVVRSFLIQYAGDVAAYVQPQVVDRFHEIRQAIKNTVWRTARAVYSATEYDEIILVGHSLGSVVVYDALNRMLVDRALGGGLAPEVASRTRLLLTFGSPLDKTAFIFSTQGAGTEAREALAASVQPLIERELLRPRWVNIYSRWDIISGGLDYYDRPDRSNRNPVENIKDASASTLLAAHVEYWRNPILFKTIIDALSN
jgi:pimeloyl-ACP methyl ester carboxylesterase